MASLLQLGIIVSLADKFSSPVKTIGNNTEKFSSKATESLKKVNNGFGDMSGKIKNLMGDTSKLAGIAVVGAGLDRFGQKIANFASKPIKAFSELEDGITNLQVAMMKSDGSISPMFDKISKKATDLSNKLPTTAKEMHNVAALGLSMGMDENVLFGGGLEGASKFAMVAMDRNFERSMAMANEIQKAWDIEPEKIGSTFDLMAKAKGVGIDPEEMQRMILKTGGTAQAMGMTGYENLAAKIPYLALLKQKTGASGETLGTNVSMLESRVLDKTRINEVKKMGINLEFADTEGKYLGFENLVQQIMKLSDLSDEARAAVIKKMFGDSVEIMNIVNTLAISGQKGADEIKNRMASQGNLDQKMGKQLSTFSARWTAFTGTLDTSFGKIGSIFEPQLKGFADSMNSFATKLGEFSEKWPRLTKILGTGIGITGILAFVAGKVLMGFAGLGFVLPYIIPVLSKLTPLFSFLGKSFGFVIGKIALLLKFIFLKIFALGNLAFATFGAIVPIALGIIAIAAFGYAIWKLTDKTTEAGSDLRTAFSSFDGFFAVLKKIAGFLVFIGSAGQYIPDWAADAVADVDDTARKEKVGKYDPEVQQKKIETINREGTGSISEMFNFSPNINVEAGANIDKKELEEMMKRVSNDALGQWDKKKNRNQQLAYGAK